MADGNGPGGGGGGGGGGRDWPMYAILEGHKVVVCDGDTWGEWWQTHQHAKHVAQTHMGINRKGEHRVWVSTVFLGLNHSIMGRRPIWFETMVFRKLRGAHKDIDPNECFRCETWEEAEAMHARMLREVKAGFPAFQRITWPREDRPHITAHITEPLLVEGYDVDRDMVMTSMGEFPRAAIFRTCRRRPLRKETLLRRFNATINFGTQGGAP